MFYGFNALSDIAGLIGILIGYWKINRSIQGVVVGYLLFKILIYLSAPVLLGYVAGV